MSHVRVSLIDNILLTAANSHMSRPTSWQQLWDQAQQTLIHAEQSLDTRSPASRILRVGQLDAELLDVEFVNLLRDPLSKALGLVNVRILFFHFPQSHAYSDHLSLSHYPAPAFASLPSSPALSRSCHYSYS
jgi:hypothetical protein